MRSAMIAVDMAGATQYPDFKRAMMHDLGEEVQPYLGDWYCMLHDVLCLFSGFKSEYLSSSAEVDALEAQIELDFDPPSSKLRADIKKANKISWHLTRKLKKRHSQKP